MLPLLLLRLGTVGTTPLATAPRLVAIDYPEMSTGQGPALGG